MSMPRRLTSRIFYSSTCEPYFRAGVRPNEFIWRGGVRTVKVIGTLSKTIEGAVYDTMKHFGDFGSAVARCLSTGSFISGGERCLAWLDSPAALNCCLRFACRARELLSVRSC